MITKDQLIEEVFKKCLDPELGIDVWTLGLIYDVKINDDSVHVLLTFTSPFCPYGPELLEDVQEKVKSLGVSNVEIEVTFDPPWKPSDELREMLGV